MSTPNPEKIKVTMPRPRLSRSNRKKRRVLRKGVPVPGPNASTVLVLPRKLNQSYSRDGRVWMQQYLNPCHASEEPMNGVPIGLSTNASIVNSRVDQDITAPPALVKLWDADSSGAQANDWFLGIFIPPWIDDCAFLFAAAFQPTDFSSFEDQIFTANIYPDWKANVTDPKLTDGVWYCKLPEPMFQQYNDVGADTIQNASAFRMVKRGVTTELISDALTNRGYITAGKWLVEKAPCVNQTTSTVFVGENATSTVTAISQEVVTKSEFCWALLFGDVTPKYITASNPRAYQCEAKSGCYMPIYCNDASHPLLPYTYRKVLALAQHDVSGSTSKATVHKVISDNQDTGAIWYQAISGAASVRIKGRHTIQAVCEPASIWGGFAQPSAQEDPLAIEQVHAVQAHLPHAYPASYNFWNVLGKLVKGLVSKVPIVGGILENLVDPAGRALGKLFGIGGQKKTSGSEGMATPDLD